MKRSRRLLCALVVLFPALVSSAWAEETILDYQSHITVHEDATLTVRETIQAVSEGKEIQRGIYRDFPTTYRTREGLSSRVGFQVKEVLKNGEPEPYHLENRANGIRVYIGRADVFLSPGGYEYTLIYTTNRQVGFFKDHDELYWNVTGNDWAFPILKASATVALPPGVAEGIIEVDAYTGPQGAKEKDFTSSRKENGIVAFAATRKLDPKEGLTILVSWKKGLIREPTGAEKAQALVKDNPGSAVGLLAILLLIVYYLVVWVMAGRDPAQGTIIPLFSPPANLSPAAVRFIGRMGFDNKALAAAVIDMAVKGILTIEEKKGAYTLTATGRDQGALPSDERKTGEALLGKTGVLELKKENHSFVQAALSVLKNSLRLQYEKVYFVTNAGYFTVGLIVSIGIVILNLIFQASRPEALFLGIWLTIWSVGVIFLVKQTVLAWAAVFSGKGGKIAGPAGALFWTLFALPFVGAEVFVSFVFFRQASPIGFAGILAVVVVNWIFHHLLKAPTRAGRKIMDGIEGFKLFLSVSEKDWLNLVHPPERTPELFEKFLPYALALDIEQRWAEKFADVLARAGEVGTTAYSPAWYAGTAWSSSTAGAFASSLGASLAGAITSSSSAPGSSSGGGGGGSSGGGGGGGGGGGW